MRPPQALVAPMATLSRRPQILAALDIQPADTVGHADRAEAADAGIGIGGEARSLLVASVDEAQLALGELIVEPEHVIARDAEHMAHAKRVKLLDEIFADGGCAFHLSAFCFDAASR